jgi:hypothetical protein
MGKVRMAVQTRYTLHPYCLVTCSIPSALISMFMFVSGLFCQPQADMDCLWANIKCWDQFTRSYVYNTYLG